MQAFETFTKKPYDLCEGTFQFGLCVIRLCQFLEKKKSNVAWTLSKQILRSATSVGANVVEGQGAQSRKDFTSKYSIARKEARETRYWLRLLLASELVELPHAEPLVAESEELIKILAAIIKKTQAS